MESQPINLTPNDPEEVKLLFMTDPHFSAYNPPSWIPQAVYLDEVEAAIEQVLAFGRSNKVDAVIWGGDFFNLKSPARNPLWFLARVISFLRKSGLIHLGIAGNHDLKYGSLAGIKGQPIELLTTTHTIHLLDLADWEIGGNGFSVRIGGRSYEHSRADQIAALRKGEATYLVGVGHFWFGKTTGEFFGEPVYGPDFLGKSEVDVYLIGHHHEDQGTQNVNGKHYVSCGSISRTGAHKQDLTRRPAAAYLRFKKSGLEIKILRPRVKPLDQLLDLAVREQIVKESEEIDQFIHSLSQMGIEEMDPKKAMEELGLELKVKEKLQEYLQKAESS